LKIKLLLVDDHVLVLDGLKQVLEKEEGLEVIDTLSDPAKLFTLVQQTSPNVVVMDIRIKSFNGIELTKLLLAKYPDIKVVNTIKQPIKPERALLLQRKGQMKNWPPPSGMLFKVIKSSRATWLISANLVQS
jgi:DNA-binding NarL/FixJ family response regulator